VFDMMVGPGRSQGRRQRLRADHRKGDLMPENKPDRMPGDAAQDRPVEDLVADLEAATAAVATALAPEVLNGWDAPDCSRLVEAHRRIRAVGGRLDGVRYTLLPRIEDDGRWRSGMARTFSTWLKVHEGIGASTARKDVSTARRLAEALPATRSQLVAGDLGLDHARIMVEVAPTSTGRTDALGWLIDARTGHVVVPEEFVQDQVRVQIEARAEADGIDPGDLDPATLDPAAVNSDQVLAGAVRDGVLVTGEQALLAEAPRLDADRFRKAAAAFAELVDPDQSDKDTDKAKNGEFFDLAKTFGGFHVSGFLTDEHGQLVQTAIQTVLGAPQTGDDRTPTQRRASGLADVARALLDNGDIGTGAAVRPHIGVTVSFTELVKQTTRTRDGLCTTCGAQTDMRGVATEPDGPRPAGFRSVATEPAPPEGEITPRSVAGRSVLDPGIAVFTDSGGPVSASLLKRLACDAQVTRIVFGPDGSVLDVGRSQRTVTGQMRRAVIARDKHCVFLACDQPPSRCEVHHALTHWADGGVTSVHNSALLCHYHHDLVDSRGITMRWTGKPTDSNAQDPEGALVSTGWSFTDRHGREIVAPSVVTGGTGYTGPASERAA
jgi:hypothetical protein